jgi:hypothetical protein
MSEKKSQYIVLSPVDHDMRRFEIGEEIELTEEQARPLMQTASPVVVERSSSLAKEANEQLVQARKSAAVQEANRRAREAADLAAQAEGVAMSKRAEAERLMKEADNADAQAELIAMRAGEVSAEIKSDLKEAGVDAKEASAVTLVDETVSGNPKEVRNARKSAGKRK